MVSCSPLPAQLWILHHGRLDEKVIRVVWFPVNHRDSQSPVGTVKSCVWTKRLSSTTLRASEHTMEPNVEPKRIQKGHDVWTNQRMLRPGCGEPTMIFHAVSHVTWGKTLILSPQTSTIWWGQHHIITHLTSLTAPKSWLKLFRLELKGRGCGTCCDRFWQLTEWLAIHIQYNIIYIYIYIHIHNMKKTSWIDLKSIKFRRTEGRISGRGGPLRQDWPWMNMEWL